MSVQVRVQDDVFTIDPATCKRKAALAVVIFVIAWAVAGFVVVKTWSPYSTLGAVIGIFPSIVAMEMSISANRMKTRKIWVYPEEKKLAICDVGAEPEWIDIHMMLNVVLDKRSRFSVSRTFVLTMNDGKTYSLTGVADATRFHLELTRIANDNLRQLINKR
jgi:hypothetical protein